MILTLIVSVVVVTLVFFIISAFTTGISSKFEVLVCIFLGVFFGSILGVIVGSILNICNKNNESLCELKSTETYSLYEWHVDGQDVYVVAITSGKTLQYSFAAMIDNAPSTIQADGRIAFTYNTKKIPSVVVKEYDRTTLAWWWLGDGSGYTTYEVTLPSNGYIYYN